MIGVDGEWTRLLKILSDAVFSEVSFDPVLLGRDWSAILGNLLLKWSTIVANAVTSFRQM